MTLAYAHSGAVHAGAAEAGWHLLADWVFDPTFLMPLVVAVLYYRGLRRYRRRGGTRFPRWRPWLLGLGVAVVGLALCSPIDALADFSFTFHMVQHELLTMVGVPLILLGAPFVPTVRGLPAWFKQRAFVPFARHPGVQATFRTLTRPPVAFAIFTANLMAWHYPTFYDWALFNDAIHYTEHFAFVAAAALFWWHIVTPYPFPSRMHMLVRMLMVAASGIPNTALGSIIAMADHPLYGYGLRDGFWGLTMLEDQQVGGALMWSMGGMLRLAVITVLFFTYVRQEEQREPSAQPVPGATSPAVRGA